MNEHIAVGPCVPTNYTLEQLLASGAVGEIDPPYGRVGHWSYLKIKLKNCDKGGDQLQTIIAMIDDLKKVLKFFGLPLSVYLKEIDVSHTDISSNFFAGLNELNPQSSIFSEIETLDLSHTAIKASDLNHLHLLTNLQKIKLDYCKELSLFEKPESLPCPSVRKISLIESHFVADFSWLQNIESKFPNIADICFSQRDGGRISSLSDSISLNDMQFPQVYSPCGHVVSIAQKTADLMTYKNCFKCYKPIETSFDITFQGRLEKIKDKWTFGLMDFEGYPILKDEDLKMDANQRRDFVYFHPPCKQVFTAKAVTHLLEEQAVKFQPNQAITELSIKILCPACPNKTSLELKRIYLDINESSGEFKSLEEFHRHRFS